MLSPVSVAAFCVIAAPWYALCWARHGTPFLREFFWRHHFERFVAGALEHNQPVWYFVPVLAIGLLPWTPLVAQLGAARAWHDRKTFFLALWAAATLVFFSISRDKLPAYVLPALPALAGLVGIVLARAESLRFALPVSAAMLGLVPVAAGVLPAALESGLTHALKTASWPAAALAAAAVIVAAVIWLEHKGRRAAAVAVIALGATAGYAWIAWRTFPEIEVKTGTRLLGRHAADRAENICLGETTRRVAYGVQYYAGRALPSCDDQPRRLRIEGRTIVARSDF
jgi:4-amino-4-deoxy-L-arabinose transferase-like glycosyltransferase